MSARRARRVRLRRRIAAAGLAVALVPVGLAQLASTVVEPTRAGEVVLPVEIATTLVAIEPDAGRMVARLGIGDNPLTNQTIDFLSSAGALLCVDVPTDADGLARCELEGVTAVPMWRAVFEGQDALLGSSDGARMPRMSTTDQETPPLASSSTESAADAVDR